jgi:predicted N-acetyltransferase YhbS
LLDGQTVAQGLAVAEHNYVGLFNIVVDSKVRNQGLGRRVVTSLLRWAKAQGASQAYLAVMADNAPAIHLYAQLGFQEQYRYWYRHRARSYPSSAPFSEPLRVESSAEGCRSGRSDPSAPHFPSCGRAD